MPPGSAQVPRDRWGNPRIIPPGGGKPVRYERMSRLAKALDEKSNLVNWKARMTAIGLGQRPALMTRLAGILATANDLEDHKVKRDLNEIAEEATEAAGGSDKASTGTGLHALTEALDAGRPLPPVTPEIQTRLDAYQEALAAYEPLAAECFVVQDEIRAAGTFDRLWRCPDGKVRVGDLKTGAWDLKDPLSVTAQLAGYTRGRHYDANTGERTPLHPDLDLHGGLLVSLPPDGGCEVVEMDLDLGWTVLMAAVKVTALRKLKAAEFFAI